MPAARLWLYSVTLFNTMRWLPALISGNERMDAIRDILRKRYQRLGESRNAYAQLMAESRGDENDDDARFPPPGLYENKTLGIMVKNHGIHECTFTFVFGEQKVHKPGQALRNLLDIVWRPLEPSDIMLCHSVEGEVLMVSPNGLVTLSLMPSPPQERARNEGASAEVGTDHKRGNGKGRVERARRKARKVARSSPGDSSAAALRRVKRAKKSHPGRLDKGSKIPKVTRRQKVTVREKRSSKDHNANDHNDVLATAAASAGITGEDIDEEEENNSAPTNAVEDVTMSGARPRHQPSEPKRPWYLHSADQYDVDRSNLADSYEMEAALPTRTKGISKGNGGQEHWGERASPGGISWDEELSLGNPTEWFEDPTWEYLSRLYRVNRLL